MDGEQVLISFEDMAGQTGCDWDYNDRVWALMVRQTGAESVVHTATYTWTGTRSVSADVTVTVTKDKVGLEGLYHWNYHVLNTSVGPPYAPDPTIWKFSIDGAATGGVQNLSSSLGWAVTATAVPGAVIWQTNTAANRLQPGQSADFSFTTPVTGIETGHGSIDDRFQANAPPSLAGGNGGQVAVPAPIIRSVTLWGMPGSSPDPAGAVIGGAPHAVILGNNPNAGGGKRIFPERSKPGANSTVYDQVRVMVELSQAPAQNKTISMYQFDVDDPSSSDRDLDLEYNEANNPNHARGSDNRGQGGAEDPTWAINFSLTVPAGKTTIDTMRGMSHKPGDNYRFVATIDPQITLGTQVKPKQELKLIGFWPTGLPLPATVPGGSYYLDYGDGDKAGVYFNGGTGAAVMDKNDKTVKSQLLTVWRKLHVERDVMNGPPPDPVQFAGAGGLMPAGPNNIPPASAQEGQREGDDDVAPNGIGGSIPKPGIELMKTNYRDAYIEVVDDLLGHNTNKFLDFVHNMAEGIPAWNPAVNAFDVGVTDDKFWCFQLIGGYEGPTDKDHDGEDNPVAVDGWTKTPLGVCFVFTEVSRDLWVGRPAAVRQAVPFDAYLERVAFHESIHIFGFEHYVDPFADEGPLYGPNNDSGTAASNKLTPGQLGVIRSKDRPGLDH